MTGEARLLLTVKRDKRNPIYDPRPRKVLRRNQAEKKVSEVKQFDPLAQIADIFHAELDKAEHVRPADPREACELCGEGRAPHDHPLSNHSFRPVTA